jgi:hypothetical protein
VTTISSPESITCSYTQKATRITSGRFFKFETKSYFLASLWLQDPLLLASTHFGHFSPLLAFIPQLAFSQLFPASILQLLLASVLQHLSFLPSAQQDVFAASLGAAAVCAEIVPTATTKANATKIDFTFMFLIFKGLMVILVICIYTFRGSKLRFVKSITFAKEK